MSGDWLQTAVGVVLGGVVGYAASRRLAEAYFRKQNDLSERMAQEQNARAEQLFEVLIRLIKNLPSALESGGRIRLGVDRDEEGRIKNANVTVTISAGVTAWVTEGDDPIVTVMKSDDARTQGGQNENSIS